MHYRNASPRLCGLNVGLKVQRGVEIAAGVPIASALDSVHADRHRAVLVRLHRLEGVRKPALRLAAFARPALKLATYLQQERTRMAWVLDLWEQSSFWWIKKKTILIWIITIVTPFLITFLLRTIWLHQEKGSAEPTHWRVTSCYKVTIGEYVEGGKRNRWTTFGSQLVNAKSGWDGYSTGN